jgi:DNA-binding transcriptional LysR family regulator
LVLSEEVHLGFVEGLTVARGLASREVAMDRLAVVVAPDHPWVQRRRPIRREELTATPLIVREAGSGTRETVDQVLSRSGDLDPAEPLLELGSNTAVKGAVLAGAGPAVLSWRAVSTELDLGRLVEVHVPKLDLDRRLRAVWPRAHPPRGPSAALLDTALRTRNA